MKGSVGKEMFDVCFPSALLLAQGFVFVSAWRALAPAPLTKL